MNPPPVSAPSRSKVRRTAVAATLALLSIGGLADAAVRADRTQSDQPGPTPGPTLYPRIVNGTATSSYPAVGSLLLYDDIAGSSLAGLCSGTLIGCRTFVTAAHCVCPEQADDAATCERMGPTDPRLLRVFLQEAGLFPVAAVTINPGYHFAEGGDVAVISLDDAATGIAPSALDTIERLPIGSVATIVGFGTSMGGRHAPNDAGIKRQGAVKTAACSSDIASDGHICWAFVGSGSNTCEGDSGGPLFADFGGGVALAGVTSGGNSLNCLAPDLGFDTDVFVNRAWILDAAGQDLGTASCAGPTAGNAPTTTVSTGGQLDWATPQARMTFDVPAGTTLVRIGLNGQIGSATFPDGPNDFDVFVRAGSPPSADNFDCSDTNPTSFGFCEVSSPRAGTWHVLVQRAEGDGAFQLTATTFAPDASASCTGDCNRDGLVTIDELLEGVRIALGSDEPGACLPFNANADNVVTIDELLAGVRSALDGCPAS